MEKRGKYIALCGVEGSGKTTYIPPIVGRFKERGYECVQTREPGGTRIGARMRAITLDRELTETTHLCELFQYLADRAQNIEEVVIPALESGKHVISDRCFLETEVYQGYARGLDLKLLRFLNRVATKNTFPDLIFIINGNPELLIQKAKGDFDAKDRLDRECLDFHRKVSASFLDVAKKYESCVIIPYRDGGMQEMHEEMIFHINERLGLNL